jgi:hypothetical protein
MLGIWRYDIKIKNIKNLKIAAYKEEFLVSIMYIKFKKINSEYYTMYRKN